MNHLYYIFLKKYVILILVLINYFCQKNTQNKVNLK